MVIGIKMRVMLVLMTDSWVMEVLASLEVRSV